MFRGITGMCVGGVRLSLPLLRVLFLSLTCISKSPCNVLLQASVRLLLPLFFMLYVMYAYIHLFMGTCMHMCSSVCWGQRWTLVTFLSSSPPYFLQQYLSLNLERTNLARQGAEQTLASFLSLLGAGIAGICWHAFAWVLGTPTQVFMVAPRTLYQLSHLSSPDKFV